MERVEAAVATVLDARDAADLVRFARYVGLRVATEDPRCGAVGADTIVVRTARLDRISVCPRSRIARVGAGVTAGELAAALAPYGLIASCDDVTAFEVVDADGNLLRASAHENEDLFWALSGRGVGFALVTAVEMQLHAEHEAFLKPFAVVGALELEGLREVKAAWDPDDVFVGRDRG